MYCSVEIALWEDSASILNTYRQGNVPNPKIPILMKLYVNVKRNFFPVEIHFEGVKSAL